MATCTGLMRRSERLEEDNIGEIVVKSPSKIQWSVTETFSFRNYADCYLRSPIFLFMDGEWRLICSRNECFFNSKCLLLELERVHCPTNYAVEFRIGFKSEDGLEVYRIREKEFTYDSQCAKISLPADSWYFKEELEAPCSITFLCSFLSISSDIGTSQNKPLKGADKLAESFEELFFSGDQHDIIIKVQYEEIRAHKLIIVVRCPVFATVFRHDTTEKNTGVITIEDCNPEAFREFLFFLYSGRLKNLSAGNVIEIYVIAEKYLVDEVKYECVEFMMRNMSDETFCDYISLALRHSENRLLKFATNYFVKNFKTITVTGKWQSFQKEYLTESAALENKALISYVTQD